MPNLDSCGSKEIKFEWSVVTNFESWCDIGSATCWLLSLLELHISTTRGLIYSIPLYSNSTILLKFIFIILLFYTKHMHFAIILATL